ncbi:MAG TPA: hypothetical protein VIC07_06445 [Acidimicrobiia bacterium]|jgi:hypothetical protein
MIWLQTPPWARWVASCLIAAGALWVELRPDPTILHPFALEDIAPGEPVDESNTELKPVPPGTFGKVDLDTTALVEIPGGHPILEFEVGEVGQVVPAGWWVIEVHLPAGADAGDASRLVLLDSGETVDGMVVTPPLEDPLGSGLGMVAVEPLLAADAARAAAEGRVAVMVASG